MANLYDQATQRQKWDQTIEQVQKMGYPQNPAQPPAFTSPQPRRPTSLGDAAAAASTPGVTQVASPAPPAAPTTAPAPAQPSEYGRQMSALGGAVVDGASWLGKTIVSAPGYGLNSRGAPAAPATAADPAAQNPTDQRLAAGTQQAPATTPAPAPAPAPAATTQPPSNMIAPGVYKNAPGQYSDNAAGMGMPANFTGQPSAQNMAAADALAGRQIAAGTQTAGVQAPGGMATPVVPNSTNDWAARNNLRNLAVSASSITANGGRFDQSGRGDSPEVSAYKAAVANDFALQQAQPGLAAAAMRENAGIQREGMQQQGANTRSLGQIALEQQKINQAGESQGFANRAAGRLEALQTAYQTAKTPEERSTLAQQIREIQGRNDPAEWGVQVTPTTKNIDGSTSMGSIVRYNKATGQTEVVQQPGQGGGAQPSANHLAALKANPKQAAQFDEVYGPGAAARALKGG